MDAPDLDRGRHLRALAALARVNLVSGAARRVWAEIARLNVERERAGPPLHERSIRVLDVACGGGDVLASVGRRAARSGVAVELHGCDVSPVALEAARAALPAHSDVRLFRLDVDTDALPTGYDLVCSSLFLHHLSTESAVRLLRDMAAATSGALLVQDLRRSRLGYLFAYVGLLLLTRSDVARRDGLTSVEGAFTMREAHELCVAAGLDGAEVRSCWPQRFSIRWRRR